MQYKLYESFISFITFIITGCKCVDSGADADCTVVDGIDGVDDVVNTDVTTVAIIVFNKNKNYDFISKKWDRQKNG